LETISISRSSIESVDVIVASHNLKSKPSNVFIDPNELIQLSYKISENDCTEEQKVRY